MDTLDPVHLKYGMGVDDLIIKGIITPEEYEGLTRLLGTKPADDILIKVGELLGTKRADDILIELRQLLDTNKDHLHGLKRQNPKIPVLEAVRDEFGVRIVDRIFSLLQSQLLESTQHDDFPWDSIICVSGHSDVSTFKAKSYSDLGDLSVVTIFASDIGTTCVSSRAKLEKLSDFIQDLNQVQRLTPTGVAIIINTVLRELPKNLQASFHGAEDVSLFLESGAKLSPSTTEYYDKEWEFFERRKSSCKRYGFVNMYVGDKKYDLIGDEPCELVLSKTTILQRALPFGKRPLFMDLGCADFRSTKAKASWKGKPHLGGKRTKRKNINRKYGFCN